MQITPAFVSLATLSLVNAAAVVMPRQSGSTLSFVSGHGAFQVAGYQGCLTAAGNFNGAPVIIHDCIVDPLNVDWTLNLGVIGPIQIFDNKCLDVTDGVNQDGTKLQIWECNAGNPNQQFNVSASAFIWNKTNKCLDLTNGNIQDGNQMQVWTCGSSNANQKWIGAGPSFSTNNEIVSSAPAISDSPVSIVASNTANGTPLVIADRHQFIHPTSPPQFPNGNITWSVPAKGSTGPISTFDGKLCIDVTNGVNADGTKLQLWSCVPGNTNQLFTAVTFGSVGVLQWNGNSNKCVDLTNGSKTPGNVLQIWTCTFGPNQTWLF